MAEPPAKRAKRTDSSAMWERNDPRPIDASHQARATNGASGVREKRDDRDRHHGRDDRRHRSRSKDRRRNRSRSRDRPEKSRRERSYSRERGGRRHKDGERDGVRDRKDRERSRSRDKHRSRRGRCTAFEAKRYPRLTLACRRAPITTLPLTLSAKRPHFRPHSNAHPASIFQTPTLSKSPFKACWRSRPTHRPPRLDQKSTGQTCSSHCRHFLQTHRQNQRHHLLIRAYNKAG